MPIVEISLWKEKANDSVKERLIKEVSEKLSEITGAPLDAVEIVINEIPMANWGKGGIPASKWKFPEKQQDL